MSGDSKLDQTKVLFRLQKDEDGYPPDDFESLWADPVGTGRFKLDNIPFFVKGVSCEDTVRARRVGKEWHFEKVVDSADHSTVRVVFFDRSRVGEVRRFVEQIGCGSEQSHLENLIAIDVPPEVDYDKLVDYLTEGEQNDLWEYEEGCLRH